jgi:CheY-like chemotaxis protein
MRSDTIGRPMEILLVEDNVMFARIAIRALRDGNIEHHMTWLTDGEETLEFLHRRGKYALAPLPDLVLLDLGLPLVDGREVLEEMKRDRELVEIPVVVMTASTDEEDRIASERLNVAAHLVKPVCLSDFLRLIRELRTYWRDDLLLPNC